MIQNSNTECDKRLILLWRGISEIRIERVWPKAIRRKYVLTGILAVIILGLSGCDVGALDNRLGPPAQTRTPAPTFTPDSAAVSVLTLIPSLNQTPGVIIVPPGIDPSTLIPIPPSKTPTLTSTPVPTDTPTATQTPTMTAMPPSIGDGTQSESPIQLPTVTPSPTVMPTSTLAPTSTLTPTFTPTHTPTPFVQVPLGLVNLRAGPGTSYPLVAQLGTDIAVAVVGQNPEGTWFQICCVNGDSVWVEKSQVEVMNSTMGVPLVIAEQPPQSTLTSTPTQTPTITPTPTATPYPFEVSWGPLFFPTNNLPLQIWVKIEGPDGEPLSGYYVDVFWRNRDDQSGFVGRDTTDVERPSADDYQFNVPAGTASGNRVEYNYKYEYYPPDPLVEFPYSDLTRLDTIDGYWKMYVVDAGGNQLSEPVEFNTLKGNNNREVYIAWKLQR